MSALEATTVEMLTTQVMAAELNLTIAERNFGKGSERYQDALKDFATVWYLLKKQRNSEEFLKEVIL